MLTIISLLKQGLKLSHSYQYQLIFILSMGLCHSTSYFTMGIKNYQRTNIHLLGLFENLSSLWLEFFFILLTTIIIVLIVVKTYMLSIQNYSIEIMDRILYPIQLYVFLIVIKQQNKDESSFQLVTKILFFITTLFNTVILIIKNVKLSLRYAGHRQKGLNRLSSLQYLLTLTKIILSIVLNICSSENFLVYIIIIGIINLLLNISFAQSINYQHPNIEYISLLTQFYLWVPFLGQLFSYTHSNSNAIFTFNFTAFLLYTYLALTKPKLLMIILENKYTCVITQIKDHIVASDELRAQKFSKNLICIINILVSLVFQTQQSKSQLIWSNSFKSNLLIFIKSKTLNQICENKVNYFQNHNQNHFNQHLQTKIYQQKQNSQKERKLSQISKNSQKTSYTLRFKQEQIDLLDQLRIRLRNNQTENQIQTFQNYGNVYQLLWEFVYPYISSNDKAFKNLRFLICYIFPDTRKNMKFRLFHSYYLSSFGKFNKFCQIQARICYKNLISSIGSKFYDEKLEKQNYQTNEKQINCLQKEGSYYHPKFNDVIKQKQIRIQIIKDFQSFFENQQLYLKIFQNIKENKQNIRKYFKFRRQKRLRIQQNLKDYVLIKNKKSHFLLMANYMNEYFIHKNQHLAKDNFEKQLSKLMILKKHQLRESISNTQSKLSFGQRIVQSMKYNLLTNKQSENIVCVVSGVKNLGLIKVSSPKFNQMMQVDSFQFPNQTQAASINYLSHFQLPIWRQEHNIEMKKIQFYEKPVHHEKKKYYLISQKGGNLIEVKFKMYFFVLYQTDLLLVLDIKYEKCQYLEVKDCHQKTVYSYGKHNLNLQSKTNKQNQLLISQLFNNFSQQQKYNTQKIQLYNKVYTLKTLKKQKLSTLIDNQFLANQRKIKNIQLTQKIHEENFILEEKKMSQQKFISFKKQFNIYQNLFNTIKLIVTCSIIFFFIAFYLFTIQQKSSQQSILGLVKDKLLIQNKIISLDTYSAIQIGVLYGIVKGRIWFDNSQEKQIFLKQLYDSLLLLKSQMHEKSQLSQIDQKNQGHLDIYLYQPTWIYGYNSSFMTHTLMRQNMFYQSLSIFVDPLLLTPHKDESYFNLSQSIKLPTTISLKQQEIISKNLYQTVTTKSYFFDVNGVVDQIFAVQKDLFEQHSNLRAFFLILFELGFTSFSILAIFFIVKMKRSILNHYNNAISVSERFRKKFQHQVTKLQSYISRLKKCSQNDLSQKMRPQKISYYEQSRKLTYIRKYTGQGLKTTIWNNKGRYQQDENKLSVLKYLFESVIFPFLRYFVILGSVFFIYQSQTQNMRVLQRYSNSLRVLSRLNTDFVVSYGISLYSKKFKSDSRIVKILKQQFYKCAQEIRQIDKVDIMYELFPFNPQIAYSVLFQPTSVSTKKLNINIDNFSSLSQKSFMQETNHLLLIQKALFNYFDSSKFHTKDVRLHLIECYKKVRHLFWFLDRITQRSYQLILQKVQLNYTIWFILLMIFLVVQFIMGSQHFNQTLIEFNQQYLNLASYDQLKKQTGFDKFVNLSTKHYFIIIDSDGSYMNHV